MAVKYSNNAAATLGLACASGDTFFMVNTGQGAKFPVVSSPDYFYATLIDSVGNFEIVKVTTRTTDTFQITRAQEGTTAKAFPIGSTVELRMTAAMLDAFKTDTLAALTAANVATALGFTPISSPDTLAERSFVATAGQTTYTFSGGYRVGATYVFVNGNLRYGSDIVATDGSTITFSPALSLNDEVRIWSLKAVSGDTVNSVQGQTGVVVLTSGAVVGTTDTQTLSNKRINVRVASGTVGSTLTPNGDTTDQHNVTGLALASLTIAAPTGTPVDGQKLVLRISDNGTGRPLTWTTTAGGYRAMAMALPTTTSASKRLYIGCIYNALDNFWDVVSVVNQA